MEIIRAGLKKVSSIWVITRENAAWRGREKSSWRIATLRPVTAGQLRLQALVVPDQDRDDAQGQQPDAMVRIGRGDAHVGLNG